MITKPLPPLKVSLTLVLSLVLSGSVPLWIGQASTTRSLQPQAVSSKRVTEGMVMIPRAIFFFRDKKQGHRVSVRRFYIDRYEITIGAFTMFLKSTGYRTSASQHDEEKMFNEVNSLGAKYPAGFISQQDAAAYCRWAGKRLPTPQEWQLAALGTDRRAWPWGKWLSKAANVNTGHVAEAGSFPNDKSPYGVFDMGGNMLEWTTEGSIGGSYVTDWQSPTNLITSVDDWVANTGFRCVADVKSN